MVTSHADIESNTLALHGDKKGFYKFHYNKKNKNSVNFIYLLFLAVQPN